MTHCAAWQRTVRLPGRRVNDVDSLPDRRSAAIRTADGSKYRWNQGVMDGGAGQRGHASDGCMTRQCLMNRGRAENAVQRKRERMTRSADEMNRCSITASGVASYKNRLGATNQDVPAGVSTTRAGTAGRNGPRATGPAGAGSFRLATTAGLQKNV